jgi:PilZ domain-containing protein
METFYETDLASVADALQACESERRQHLRVPAPTVRVGGLWTNVHDISLGGICLILSIALQPGEEYELVMTDGLFRCKHSLKARVTWCRRGKAGLQWVGLSPGQERWLAECLRGGSALPRVALVKNWTGQV